MHQNEIFTKTLLNSLPASKKRPATQLPKEPNKLSDFRDDPYLLAGTIDWYNNIRGFGFIEVHGGNRVYFHVTSVEDQGEKGEPKKGQTVHFYEEYSSPYNNAKRIRRHNLKL